MNLRTPRTCETRKLTWTENGFEKTPSDAYCRVLRAGCRNSTRVWNRPGNSAYQRPYSYGCEVMRSSSPVALTTRTGQCVPNLDPAAAGDPDRAWKCRCLPGHYGALCQYRTLQGGCFDNTLEPALYPRANRDPDNNEEECYWNAEIGQFQPITWLDAATARTVERVACAGTLCSHVGTCQHEGMDQAALEVYNNPLDPANIYSSGLVLPSLGNAKPLFQQALRARLLAQKCVCPPGFIGKTCEILDCVGACGLGACDNRDALHPTCQCPRLLTGVPLTSPDHLRNCGGPVCGTRVAEAEAGMTRGNIVQHAVTRAWSCACVPPYYSSSANPGSYQALCNTICAPVHPVTKLEQMLAMVSGRMQCVVMSKADIAARNAALANSTRVSSSSTGGARRGSSSSTGTLRPPRSSTAAASSTGGASQLSPPSSTATSEAGVGGGGGSTASGADVDESDVGGANRSTDSTEGGVGTVTFIGVIAGVVGAFALAGLLVWKRACIAQQFRSRKAGVTRTGITHPHAPLPTHPEKR